VRELFGRGVRLLVDKVGVADDILTIASPETGTGLLTEDEYRTLSRGFWYHLTAATKKWRRGELWVAMTWCEGSLTASTIALIRWWTQVRRPSTDVWHASRFIEEWLDPRVMNQLATTRTGYGSTEIGQSLRSLAELFRKLEPNVEKPADTGPRSMTPRCGTYWRLS